MEFLLWHYGPGLNQYLRRWIYAIGWVVHYFSLPLLLTSLFSPWKRLVDTEDLVGFNLPAIFRQLSFNLISRTIGAIVRITLFFAGLLLLLPVIFVGLIGLIFWLILPPIGLPYFLLSDPHQKRFLTSLTARMQADPKTALHQAINTSPGRFLLAHTGVSAENLISIANPSGLNLDSFHPESYSDIIYKFIEAGVWDKNRLRQLNLESSDLLLAARWWDSRFSATEPDSKPFRYSRPGIGLELLFGYTPTLNQYATDLSITQPFTHRLIGREELVSRIERVLTSGDSVILTGLPGVGKKTIILEFARRAREGLLGPKMIYQRVMELDTNFLLSQTVDLNQKKALLSAILAEAATAGNVIVVIKDVHRLTHPGVEGLDFTDVFEKFLERGRFQLKLICISTQSDYDRFVTANTRLRKFLEPVVAQSPSPEQAMDILIDFANDWESKKSLTISTQALRAIIAGCDQYITDTPFPEKALEILDNVISYIDRNHRTAVTTDDVNAVLSEATGISLARLTSAEKSLLADLESVFHQRLIGQDAAVSLIAKSLRARSVGAKSQLRPLGSFLFLGPTGVGKTETAKTLARVYYGSDDRILRFDMSEYAGDEGLALLIGSPDKNLAGRLTTDIKNHPASLLLLDEIEKARPEVRNIFLTLLDEGFITDAYGRKINCRNLFVIATSNAGAEFVRQQVTAGTSAEQLQKSVVDYVQKQGIFSPEFLNRFDGVVVYEPLQQSQLVQIAQLQLADLGRRLDQQGITLTFDPEVSQKLARDGYEPEFGARPMRRLVDITLGDLLGQAILKDQIHPGDTVRLAVENGQFALRPVANP